jgi:hypothetical protein
MAYTQRQILVRAQEAAALILRALDRERMVGHFVDSYAVEYGRPSCTAYPGQYQEVLALLRREALLAIATWMEHEVPQHAGKQTPGRARAASPRRKPSNRAKGKKAVRRKRATAKASEAMARLAADFQEEFLDSIRAAHRWRAEEDTAFREDLALYRKLAHREGGAAYPRRLRGTPGGPFVDRCGVLLDPSMFEAARRAAARFEERLRVVAETTLKTVFSRRRAN